MAHPLIQLCLRSVSRHDMALIWLAIVGVMWSNIRRACCGNQAITQHNWLVTISYISSDGPDPSCLWDTQSYKCGVDSQLRVEWMDWPVRTWSSSQACWNPATIMCALPLSWLEYDVSELVSVNYAGWMFKCKTVNCKSLNECECPLMQSSHQLNN